MQEYERLRSDTAATYSGAQKSKPHSQIIIKSY